MAYPDNRPYSLVPTREARKPYTRYGMAKVPWEKRNFRDTVLSDVEPGDKTGIYYITLCNVGAKISYLKCIV